MLFEIRYQRKSDPKSLRKLYTGSANGVDRNDAVKHFRETLDDPDDYMIMFVRDISDESITLDVKDVSQKSKGKI
jgi:DNA-dependent RNA polymerase auxiliary subunit epsilon